MNIWHDPEQICYELKRIVVSRYNAQYKSMGPDPVMGKKLLAPALKILQSEEMNTEQYKALKRLIEAFPSCFQVVKEDISVEGVNYAFLSKILREDESSQGAGQSTRILHISDKAMNILNNYAKSW